MQDHPPEGSPLRHYGLPSPLQFREQKHDIPINIDLENKKVRYGDFEIDINVQESSHFALTKGVWDTTAQLLNNKEDIQNIPNLAQQRGIIELIKGNYQHAHSILESSFLKQNVEMDNFSEYYVLSKLLSGNDRGLPELTSYIDELGLRALPFYNIMGQYEKADSIASIYDAKFLGPCIITRYISKNPLYFHLSATPNFSARLKELGIDPMQYESENYYQFPLVTLDN